MKKIPLSQGKFTLVDDDCFEELSRYKWCILKLTYGGFAAVRVEPKKTIYMHRQITNAPKGLLVDHINHNTLDNRCSNLRLCTSSQNSMNRKTQKGTSVYKGVTWHKKNQKWMAQIKLNEKNYNIGYRDSEIECAELYDKKAKELFGEFAYLNFRN